MPIDVISQVFSVIVVVASLVFVGRQIHESTMATRSATTQAVHESFVNAYVSYSQNREAMSIYIKGGQDHSSLNDEERAMYMAYAMALFAAFQSAYDQWRHGHLRNDLWEGWERLVSSNLQTPGVHAAWKERSFAFSSEFGSHIELLIKKPTYIGRSAFGKLKEEPDELTHIS